MSGKVPPDNPEEKESGSLSEIVHGLGEAVAQSTTAGLIAGLPVEQKSLFERIAEARARALVNELYERMLREQPKKNAFPEWLVTTLQGITLATIVGCAFWLGSLSSNVSRSAEKIDKLNDAVMSPSREGMANRLSVIETKLDTINEKLDKAAPAPKYP